jgi:L-ascorbate metabolism protein UlaG (beta-lactamase superfamily)
MHISWYGQSCFKIQTKPKRGGKNVTITTDIFDIKSGLRPPQGQMDIITLSNINYRTKKVDKLEKKSFIIDASGEYSLEGVNIEGIESWQDTNKEEGTGRNTIFLIDSEDMRICHLGNLGHTLTEKQVEAIGEVDILFIPVGNPDKLDMQTTKRIIGQLEPGILIPMNYKIKGLKEKLDDCTTFCKEFGGNGSKKEDKLTIKAKDVKDMENHLVVLNVN